MFVWVFVKIFLIASAIAIPAAYFLADYWLENFVYRSPISVEVFIASIIGLLVITLLSVSYDLSNRHAITLLDSTERVLASTVTSMPGTQRKASIVQDVPVAPAGNGLILRGTGYRTSIGLISNTLFLDGRGAVGAHRVDAAGHLATT